MTKNYPHQDQMIPTAGANHTAKFNAADGFLRF